MTRSHDEYVFQRWLGQRNCGDFAGKRGNNVPQQFVTRLVFDPQRIADPPGCDLKPPGDLFRQCLPAGSD